MFYVIVNWIPRCILDLVIWCFGIQYCWYFGSPVHYSPHCVEDDYCVAIHDLSPVLTALFSIELGGFNSINEWFSAKDIRFMEKMVQLSTLHIWINSHIFQNNRIFMK